MQARTGDKEMNLIADLSAPSHKNQCHFPTATQPVLGCNPPVVWLEGPWVSQFDFGYFSGLA